jgi:fructokinase
MDQPLDVIAIGEVLWDIFVPPSIPPKVGASSRRRRPVEATATTGGRRPYGGERGRAHLGGAPFNFAVHCRHLGARSAIVSRVGQDELGNEILSRTRELGMDDSLIQRDANHPTGQVRVTLQADGQPTFDIRAEAAYDYIAADPAALARIRTADVICFGTLAQRHPVARRSIAALLDANSRALFVCDLNLRPPHYTGEVVRNALSRCNLLKLNGDELRVIQEMLRQDDLDEDAFLLYLLEAYGLELVCVTLGARGCILRTRRERVVAPGYPCQVVDTVGSGDAFTAALVIKYTAGDSLAEVADFANRVGAYVATQHGATSSITPDALEDFAARSRQDSKTNEHTNSPIPQ